MFTGGTIWILKHGLARICKTPMTATSPALPAPVLRHASLAPKLTGSEASDANGESTRVQPLDTHAGCPRLLPETKEAQAEPLLHLLAAPSSSMFCRLVLLGQHTFCLRICDSSTFIQTTSTRSPSSALLPFFGRVPLLKWTTEEGHPYSDLSTEDLVKQHFSEKTIFGLSCVLVVLRAT